MLGALLGGPMTLPESAGGLLSLPYVCGATDLELVHGPAELRRSR